MFVAVLIGRYPADRYSLNRGYVEALGRLGAAPLVVPAGSAWRGVSPSQAFGSCGAVLLTGGGDVTPGAYGATPTTDTLDDLDEERDEVELAFARWALESGRPLLGICRGIQLLTVACGGTLVQDLPSAGFSGHWDLEHEYEPSHAIKVEAGSRAERALGAAERVNSIHHQAVADPGPYLVATGWSPDGVIEAVEAPDGAPVLGLQWHPERLAPSDDRHLAPFRWLIEAAR